MKPFEITDSAKAQIERLLEKNTGKYAVSLAVLGGGCAGFKYDWGFADTKESVADGDHIEDWGTGRFVVDETSIVVCHGHQDRLGGGDLWLTVRDIQSQLSSSIVWLWRDRLAYNGYRFHNRQR